MALTSPPTVLYNPIPSVVRALEPTLGADEPRYREYFLRVDVVQAHACVLVALVLSGLGFAVDVLFWQGGHLGPMLVLRGGFILSCIPMLAVLRRVRSAAALDRSLFLWTLGLVAMILALTALRTGKEADSIALVGSAVLVLCMYGIVPTPLLGRAIPAAIASVGFLLIFRFLRDSSVAGVLTFGILLLALHVVGAWASAQLHGQRRRRFVTEETLRAAVADRDRLIEQLRQSHKMEAMGQMVGGVAHDFNNILGTMLASVTFLLDDLGPENSSRGDAEMILSAVRRGSDLTRQLLAFSRKQVLEPKLVSLNDLVSDAQRLLMRTIGEDIAVHVSLGEHLAAVRVDPGQVQQILLNLAVNARDAMPGGGTLRLATANVTLSESTPMSHAVAAPGEYVVLTVTDTGIGMDEATLARIFEPFFTTKPPGKGTGLGLATVYGIVEQSGGHLRVASAPRRGTTFEVFIPAEHGKPDEVLDSLHHMRTSRGSETILLAEDDVQLRTLTARVLARQGYRVLEAADGAEALRVAAAHRGPIHLLATDMVMPAKGGYDVAQNLIAARPGLRVLYMSGYAADRGGDMDVDTFLQKPVDVATLARKVRQLLDEPSELEAEV